MSSCEQCDRLRIADPRRQPEIRPRAPDVTWIPQPVRKWSVPIPELSLWWRHVARSGRERRPRSTSWEAQIRWQMSRQRWTPRGCTNPQVREFVAEYAELTGAARIEVVSAADDARLISRRRSTPASCQPAGEGRYYSRSYYKDTARSEERTIVATNNEKDRGVYNNWRPASEMKPMLHDRMRGASAGKTMYVIPYLMSPPGNELAPWAAGVELTDSRTGRPAHDPDVAGGRAVPRRARGPRPLRARRPRDRRPGAPRPGHRRRPALLRHGRRRAHDPALRVVVRRQRAARQDRPRPAAGRVRRVGQQEVPRRAVHAHRHPRQGDRQGLPHLWRLPERLRQDQPGHDGWRPTRSATATTCRSTATTSRGCGSTRSPAG